MTERRQSISKEEAKLLIRGSKRQWFKSLVSFLYIYGTRISEALNLEREDFTVEGDNLVVKIAILKRRDKATHKLRANIKTTPFIDIVLKQVVATGRGERVWKVTRQHAWATLKRYNKDYYTHLFRRSRVNALIKQKPTLWELQDFFGWKDPRTAMNYLRLNGALASKFADKIT